MWCSVARRWQGRKFRVDRTHLPLMDSRDLFPVGSAQTRIVSKNPRMDPQLTVNVIHSIPSAFVDVYVRAWTSHLMQIRFDSSLCISLESVLCDGKKRASEKDISHSPSPSSAKFVERIIWCIMIEMTCTGVGWISCELHIIKNSLFCIKMHL